MASFENKLDARSLLEEIRYKTTDNKFGETTAVRVISELIDIVDVYDQAMRLVSKENLSFGKSHTVPAAIAWAWANMESKLKEVLSLMNEEDPSKKSQTLHVK